MNQCEHPLEMLDYEPFPLAKNEFFVLRCTKCKSTIGIANNLTPLMKRIDAIEKRLSLIESKK